MTLEVALTVFHIAAASVVLIVSLLVTSLILGGETEAVQSGMQKNRIPLGHDQTNA
jgi:hypothetical protein